MKIKDQTNAKYLMSRINHSFLR